MGTYLKLAAKLLFSYEKLMVNTISKSHNFLTKNILLGEVYFFLLLKRWQKIKNYNKISFVMKL